MPPTTPRTERQEGWKRGEVKAVEGQRISLDSLIRSENVERDLDGSLIASPGFNREFTVALHRQISDMEDAEDARWTGDVVDDLTNFIYGFQSRKHVHPGLGLKASTFTRALAFLGSPFNGSTDQLTFRLRASDASELLNVEIRFREAGGDYFSVNISPAGWTDGVYETETVLQSAFTETGTPEWTEIVDMQIISGTVVVDAGGVTDLSFDNFFIERPADAVGEPIWTVHGFERVATPQRYLMVSSGSEIWSYLGGVGTKRQTSLDAGRPPNMLTANDMVISANGSDNIKRWDASEVTFRDLGVPVPADTITGAEHGAAGDVEAGLYFFVTVFSMGKHGEGNSVVPASRSVNIVSGPDRINYTVVPIGPPGTSKRLIYRTQKNAGAFGPLKFDVAINDNVTTSVQSNVSDANLGDTLQQDGNQPLVGSMLVHANRTLFLAGVPGSESSLFYSDTTRAANRTIEQWKVTNEFRLNPDDGDRITGIVYFQRFIYIFKRRSTWILDPVQLGAPVQISTTYGSVGHRCLVDGGSVLYAWSDEHGPLEIRGQTITPIGILESNLEREGPRVGDINGNVPATAASVLGSIINSQADFKAGTLVDVTADDIIGSVVLSRNPAAGSAKTTNLIPLAGTTFIHSESFDSPIPGHVFQANGFSNALDGNTGTEITYRLSIGSSILPLIGASMTGTLTATMAQTKSISQIQLKMRDVRNLAGAEHAIFTVAYEAPGGGFVTVGTVTATDALINHTFNFAPVLTRKIRYTFNMGPFSVSATSVRVAVSEFQAYESGFLPSGVWTSGSINLGQTPSEWGRFNTSFVTPPTGTLEFFMRSAPADDFTGIPFEMVTPGISPDLNIIPLNPFIQWRVVFTSSTSTETPRLDDLSILFTAALSDFIRPRFESAGILFDRRYWLSAVSRDDTNPSLVWKFQQLLKSWSRHPGFNMSSWTRLSEDFYSGSAIDGRVYRNVMDADGEVIRSHAGVPILCIVETKDSAPNGQDRTSTITDFVVACRNESKNRKNLIRNSNFEDWANIPTFTPGPSGLLNQGTFPGALAAWEFEGNTNFGQGILRETITDNVVSKLNSAKISWSNPSTSAFVTRIFGSNTPQVVPNDQDLIMRHDVSLEFVTDYFLTFDAKKNFGIPINIFRIQDFRSDGNHEYLQSDGSWSAVVEDFVGDDTAITESMEKQVFSFKTNTSDPFHVFYRIQFGYLISTSSTPGVTWIDDVTLFEATETVPRFLHVLPILDGQDDVPERRINLTGENDGKLDVGVRRSQFRVDRALVRNVRFRFRHQEAEAKFKVFGLYVNSVPEAWRP